MITKRIETLIESINHIVSDDGLSRDKKQQVLDIVANNDAETAFEEFLSWFEAGPE